MVEQQELKYYDLQSPNSFVEFKANDPRLNEMWYIVSAITIVKLLDISLGIFILDKQAHNLQVLWKKVFS